MTDSTLLTARHSHNDKHFVKFTYGTNKLLHDFPPAVQGVLGVLHDLNVSLSVKIVKGIHIEVISAGT